MLLNHLGPSESCLVWVGRWSNKNRVHVWVGLEPLYTQLIVNIITSTVCMTSEMSKTFPS